LGALSAAASVGAGLSGAGAALVVAAALSVFIWTGALRAAPSDFIIWTGAPRSSRPGARCAAWAS
jgi:hypothetical protein